MISLDGCTNFCKSIVPCLQQQFPIDLVLGWLGFESCRGLLIQNSTGRRVVSIRDRTALTMGDIQILRAIAEVLEQDSGVQANE
jgi:hypothetical protein